MGINDLSLPGCLPYHLYRRSLKWEIFTAAHAPQPVAHCATQLSHFQIKRQNKLISIRNFKCSEKSQFWGWSPCINDSGFAAGSYGYTVQYTTARWTSNSISGHQRHPNNPPATTLCNRLGPPALFSFFASTSPWRSHVGLAWWLHSGLWRRCVKPPSHFVSPAVKDKSQSQTSLKVHTLVSPRNSKEASDWNVKLLNYPTEQYLLRFILIIWRWTVKSAPCISIQSSIAAGFEIALARASSDSDCDLHQRLVPVRVDTQIKSNAANQHSGFRSLQPCSMHKALSCSPLPAAWHTAWKPEKPCLSQSLRLKNTNTHTHTAWLAPIIYETGTV